MRLRTRLDHLGAEREVRHEAGRPSRRRESSRRRRLRTSRSRRRACAKSALRMDGAMHAHCGVPTRCRPSLTVIDTALGIAARLPAPACSRPPAARRAVGARHLPDLEPAPRARLRVRLRHADDRRHAHRCPRSRRAYRRAFGVARPARGSCSSTVSLRRAAVERASPRCALNPTSASRFAASSNSRPATFGTFALPGITPDGKTTNATIR